MHRLLLILVLCSIVYYTESTKECRKLRQPSRGNIYYLTADGADKLTYPVGYTLRFVCDDGFTLTGTTFRSCSSNGRWSGQHVTCRAPPCRRPEAPENGGIIEDRYVFHHGDVVSFFCNAGYQLNGISRTTCELGSVWNDHVPTCQPNVFCSDPGYISNGTRTEENIYSDVEDPIGSPLYIYESTVTYSCNARYRMVGASSISCLLNATWSADVPYCE
ncbi:complement decay-accelerating factor-like, partial [Saccoglossus kowalevskii]|uniref:CUB and sushi domain-containing protein 3-like n=1 Tax=Saccoglossus kowalevskii TaxID=10224 RepID=A0ABM0MSE4_SACKO